MTVSTSSAIYMQGTVHQVEDPQEVKSLSLRMRERLSHTTDM